MTFQPDATASIECSPSTTHRWAYVRIPATPERPKGTGAKHASKALARRNPREPLTMTVRFRAGPECWWEIKARGRVWRVPGHLCVHDVLAQIAAGGEPRR